MQISFDPMKRAKTLRERGLDFLEAERLFAGKVATFQDNRFDYGEIRYQSFGYLHQRLVCVIWTPRAEVRHIISMRKCNDREQAKLTKILD